MARNKKKGALNYWRREYRALSDEIRITKQMARNGHTWGQYKLVGRAQSVLTRLKKDAWYYMDARPVYQAAAAEEWAEFQRERQARNAKTPDEKL